MITVILLCVAALGVFAGMAFGQLYISRTEKMWDKCCDTYYVANRACYIFSLTICVFMVVGIIFHWW